MNFIQTFQKTKQKKEDNMYKKLFLQEKINRIKAEMALMQERFTSHQAELQQTEMELKAILENEEENTPQNESEEEKE
jgi:hypothetical protein